MCGHCKKNNGKWIIAIIAAVAAIAGVAVLVATYLKKQAAFLSDSYDYDDELFYNDDEPACDCDELSDVKPCCEPTKPSATASDIIDAAFNDEDENTI